MVNAQAHPPLNSVARRPVRVDTGDTQGVARVRMILGTVCDPEIPVLSIEDLGILRDVQQRRGQYIITITPTYTGCPAMQTIEQDMRTTLELNGVTDYTLITRLAPAWTTDWLSEQGRKKLLAFGIAPPVGKSGDKRALTGRGTIVCPQCQSADTSMISEFGSTACKALYKCNSCQEPFDYFKCL